MKSTPRTLLSLDSACGPCSVALLVDGQPASTRHELQTNRQTARLVPMIEEVLREAGVAYDALDMIVSTIGPGSFTGIRISLSAALGMGLTKGVPVFGMSTLAATAYASRNHATGDIAAVLNAGKGEVYCQRYQLEPFAPLDEAMLYHPNALPPADSLTHELPDARQVALLAYHHPELLRAPEPLYIRPPDAKPMQAVV